MKDGNPIEITGSQKSSSPSTKKAIEFIYLCRDVIYLRRRGGSSVTHTSKNEVIERAKSHEPVSLLIFAY